MSLQVMDVLWALLAFGGPLTVVAVVGYFVIRVAVRHGQLDAEAIRDAKRRDAAVSSNDE